MSRGTEWVPGVRLDRVGALVGLEHDDTPELSPAELVARLDHILETALGLAGQIPADHLGDILPHRDRTYLALVNHLVEIAVGFRQVTNGAPLDPARAAATPTTERTLAELGERCRTTRSEVAAWWATTDDPTCSGMVETFAGDQDLHRVLERTTWHCAQHTRQLAMVLELLGIAPDAALGPDDLAGLPVPRDVWDG